MAEDQKTGSDEKPEQPSGPSCERCGAELPAETGLCPECDEPAPKWMVYLVYALVALFAAGLIYRLIFP